MFPVVPGQVLQRFQRIRDRDDLLPFYAGIGIHDGPGRAGLKGFQRILVAVKVLAFQSKEQFPAFQGTAVGGHAAATGLVNAI